MNRHSIIALILLLATLSVSSTASATKFALAERSDAEIVEHCSGLLDRIANVPANEKTSAIFLEVGELLSIGDETSSVNNRLLYVLDPADEDLLTRTEDFSWGFPVTKVEAFVVRNGSEVIRVPARDARTAAEDSGGSANSVVIGFPPVAQGDILGWTVTLEGNGVFSQLNRFLSREAWICHSRFILKIDEGLGYTARIHNLPASRSTIDSRKNDKNQPTLIDIHAYDLPRYRESSYSPSPLLVAPYVEAALSAIYWEAARAWFRLDNWNAIALNLDNSLHDLLESDGRLEDKVDELCRGIDHEYDRADALFRFVRDDIANIGSWERRGGETPAKDVLRSGLGSPMDKTILLVAMMREAGLAARIGFFRDRSLGDFDRDAAGLWQVTDTAVLVEDPSTGAFLWWMPGDPGAAPRALPPNLRGAEVVFFRENLKDVSDRKWRNAWARHTYDLGGTYRAFRSSVASADWHQFSRTDGDPTEVLATRVETRVLDLESGEEQVVLEATGLDRWARRLRGTGDAADVGGDYVDCRNLPGTITGPVVHETSDDEQVQSIAWSSDSKLPARAGATWILPPDLLFGDSLLSFWEGADRGPFYMSHASVRESVVDVSLPPGMTADGFEPVIEIENAMFTYSGRITQEGDTLAIRRTVHFKPELLREHAMPMLDGDIQKIFRFATQSIVVRNTSAGR